MKKICTSCGEELSTKFFSPRKPRKYIYKDGFDVVCKMCRNTKGTHKQKYRDTIMSAVEVPIGQGYYVTKSGGLYSKTKVGMRPLKAGVITINKKQYTLTQILKMTFKDGLEFGTKKQCDYCGNNFQAKTKRNRFCSSECQRSNTAAKRAEVTAKPEEQICVMCGESFMQTVVKQMFCNPKCKDKHSRFVKLGRITTKQDVVRFADAEKMVKYGTKHDANINAMKKEYDTLCDQLEAMDSIITPEANAIIKRVQMLENFVL